MISGVSSPRKLLLLAAALLTLEEGGNGELAVPGGEISANDYIQPLFQNKTLEMGQAPRARVISSIALSIEALIKLGAKTMYVPGVFPMGCTRCSSAPFPATAATLSRAACGLTTTSPRSQPHAEIEARRAPPRPPGVSIIYVDYYDEVLSLITKPLENGFAMETLLDACYPVFVPRREAVQCQTR
ncbi:hypothetical protein ZWY2020_031792 [Hordeum vulgare]|nr:hypothetical protein ZWY2020_031792 [Hordeum vulgare]